MLLVTLGTMLLGNMLIGKGINRTGERIIRTLWNSLECFVCLKQKFYLLW